MSNLIKRRKMMKEFCNPFEMLQSINCNGHTEKKGGLTYLSWAWAWQMVKKTFPDAFYTIYENKDGMNYHTDGRTCWVKTGVTINGLEHIEYLPVMDYKNNSIPLAKVTSTDVNKSIQRSLTKACARHGLGLYIYAGEDLPAGEAEAVKEQMDVAVEEALLAVKEAKTRDELVRLWKELTGLHANQRFIDALNEKQRELNDIAA
jgi:hypothetical protein